LKIAKIGGVFHYTSTVSGDMANWRPPLDSARQIGLFTFWNGVLIVVRGAWSVDLKIH